MCSANWPKMKLTLNIKKILNTYPRTVQKYPVKDRNVNFLRIFSPSAADFSSI